MKISRLIHHQAVSRGNKPAVVEGDRTVTFSELDSMIRKTARKLASLGISRGDAVGIRLADTIDNLVTALAIARIGAVQLAIDRHSTSEEWADLSAAHDLQITVAAAGTQAPHGVAAVALDDEWYSDVRRAPDELTLPDD